MSPNQIKSFAAMVCTAATALESAHVLPAGVATAIGTVIVWVAGLYHPAPKRKA